VLHCMKLFGEGSVDFGVVIEKNEADQMQAALLEELRPFWLGRKDPSVIFSIFGKMKGVTRDKAIFGDVDGSVAPLYRYGSRKRVIVHPWTPTTRALRDLIERRTGIRCTHLVVNLYVDGADKIGFHRVGGIHGTDNEHTLHVLTPRPLCSSYLQDKDRDFTRPDYHVVTISLGATRKLRLHKRCDKKIKQELDMLHGSCYMLNRATNEVWKHAVPQAGKRNPCHDLRLGLTYRTVATRFDSATNEIIHADGRRQAANDDADDIDSAEEEAESNDDEQPELGTKRKRSE
jgi:alkylated DNA repair dioxygenase AlkB